MKKTQIKSFEEGAAVSGDILTGGKVRRRVRIGLLTCGYFEYWRMYPTLREKVEEDLADVTARVKSMDCDVVESGMVDTLDSAAAAGSQLAAAQVDAVLLVYGTYTADFITLTALDKLADKPLMVFSMQAQEDIDRNGDYESSLRNSGIIGVSQLTGTLRKMGREYTVVVGSKNDDRAYGKFAAQIRALQAVQDIKEANIGVIGHVFRGMYDIELSKTFFKRTFGANVIMIQSGHLMDAWQSVPESEVQAETDALNTRFNRKHIGDEDVRNAVRLMLAMKRVAERFSLDAMCFLDQHYIQRQVRTSARIGASLLMERTHMCVNCEGDLGGLVTMMLMKSVSGRNPLMGEWGEYDATTDGCFIIGHGIGTPDLAADEKDILLTRTPEEWGFDGAGCNYELIVRPGPATVAHIMEGPEGYRMMLSAVESLPFPKLAFDELHALVRTPLPVKEYLEKLFAFGVSHHCILGLSDMTEELREVCRLLGVRCFSL